MVTFTHASADVGKDMRAHSIIVVTPTASDLFLFVSKHDIAVLYHEFAVDAGVYPWLLFVNL